MRPRWRLRRQPPAAVASGPDQGAVIAGAAKVSKLINNLLVLNIPGAIESVGSQYLTGKILTNPKVAFYLLGTGTAKMESPLPRQTASALAIMLEAGMD